MTPKKTVAVKAYGWEWANDFGFSMESAAQRLLDQGFTTVLAQNLIDPLPSSAVDQKPPSSGYDDYRWTQTLRERGLEVYQTTAVFFDPEEYRAHPELVPVDQWGRTAPEFGWYRGINPTNEAYLERKIAKICRAVEVTQPDGLFVSFFRFPGFWELWLPDAPGFDGTKRAEIAEYGFDEGAIALFQLETGVDLGGATGAALGKRVLEQHHDAWVKWKTGWMARVARRLKEAIHEVNPTTKLMLNGFGLGSDDFENASVEVLGQDLTQLDEYFDVHELMFYFQIQKRDPLLWIPERVSEVRQLSRLPILADLQAGPEYLESIYDGGRRAREISPEEWVAALQGVEKSGADGVLVYSWRDLLRDEAQGGERILRLQQYGYGELPRYD